MATKPEPPDPNAHLKLLEQTFGVTHRIHQLAVQRKASPPKISKETIEREQLATARENRAQRSNSLGTNHLYICEQIAEHYGVSVEQITDGIIDDENHITLLQNFTMKNGRQAIVFYYKEFQYPSIESGRHVPAKKNSKMIRAIISDGTDTELSGQCVLAFRANVEKELDLRSIQEDCHFMELIVEQPEQNALSACLNKFDEIISNSCTNYKDYGLCRPEQRHNFLHGLSLFTQSLKSTDNTLGNIVQFEIDSNLYKGHLLVPFQIDESSQNQQKVLLVEKYFLRWLRQMETIITEGKQIRRDPPDVGPLNELHYWQKMLARYSTIEEFVLEKPFLNHLLCLVKSKSKLVKKWKLIDEELGRSLNIARDNVRFVGSLEPYWDPLYRCTPEQIPDYLKSLLNSLRNIYTSSKYFNTVDCVTSFLVKSTNQLTIACKNYLTNQNTVSIFEQHSNDFKQKIKVCINVFNKYREIYYETIKSMEKMENVILWNCSPKYIFAVMDMFMARLEKLTHIIDVKMTYSVLSRIRISGMDKFESQILKAYKKITSVPYPILDQRVIRFDKDYKKWCKKIEKAEEDMQKFVKTLIAPIETSDGVLLILKRFDRVQLDCLCMDHRYLDVFTLYEKELTYLKDVFNEQRNDPPIANGLPPSAGRLMWIRSLKKRIDTPMNKLKTKLCVISHRNAQLSVKLYNFLSQLFLHYEMQIHKGWYDYVEEVRKKLNCRILRRNLKTNWLQINFHPSIYQLIRESECILKMDLVIPYLSDIVVYCQDKIQNSKETLKQLINHNNKIRMSIDMVFLNISRPILKILELAFKPGLSTITWTSENLDDYFKHVQSTLHKFDDFFKQVKDIQSERIEQVFDQIADMNLIYLPPNAVSIFDLYDGNINHRKKIQKIIQMRSITSEKSVVELINKFVEVVEINPLSRTGQRQYQLPPDEINESNKKIEEKLPIDKFDWISFDKIFRPVCVLPESDRSYYFFKDYEDIYYGLSQLHIDCMDIFSYFNSQLLASLVKCSRTSLENLRKRSNLENSQNIAGNTSETPLIITEAILKIPDCHIEPTIDTIQDEFKKIIDNVIETFYSTPSWGKQAKTSERNKRKPLIDETYFAKSFFESVRDHKETLRCVKSFAGGYQMMRPFVDKYLKKVYNDNCDLWCSDKNEKIESFIQSNSLIIEIHNKFALFDAQTLALVNIEQTTIIGSILIDMRKAYSAMVEHSKTWKLILGEKINVNYEKKLEKMVEFINDIDYTLSRPIRNLDDVRVGMNCLEKVRENMIEMDLNTTNIVETYQLFTEFEIYISTENQEDIDNLKYNFSKMITQSQEVSLKIDELKNSLLQELTNDILVFQELLQKFDYDFITRGPLVENISANEGSDRLFLFQSRFDDLWRRYESYSSAEKLFGLPGADYSILHNRKKEFEMLNKLYSLYFIVLKTINDYNDILWCEVLMQDIIPEVTNFHNSCTNLPQGMQTWKAFIELKTKIDQFNEISPILTLMTSKVMKDRHWQQLENLLSYKFNIDDPRTTLGNILEAPILQFKREVQEIITSAEKEDDIEAKLGQISFDWSNVNLQFAPFKNRGDLLLKESETMELLTSLDDSLIIMNSLLSNRYNQPFNKEITLWIEKIISTVQVLEKWLAVQNLWVYLEAAFVGGDISRQLQTEAKRFAGIDKMYVKLILRAQEILNVIETCSGDETMLSMLTNLFGQLELCHNALIGYFELKRIIFPRFFFISNTVLMEILNQASDPTTIQSHLLNLFSGIASVDFEENSNDKIIAINSDNGEHVPLDAIVICGGGVEVWIGKLLLEVQSTISNVLSSIASTLSDPKFEFNSDFHDYCGQAELIGIQMLWTGDTENAIQKSRTSKTIIKRTSQLFLNLLSNFMELTMKDLSNYERIKYETIIMVHIHQRDVFDELIRLKVKFTYDFEWQKQTRIYYSKETDEVIVKITDVNFIYQNEYLGVIDRLVITPLTDRCYITLAHALKMNLGGALIGPAGTGKTETIKDMGHALGKFVIIFNCSQQMCIQGLECIYKGLAQSGSWGCFNEFNRMKISVLSIAAQQISCLLNAKKERKASFLFSDGDMVSMNPEFGLFATMCPDELNSHHQQLPANLKIQFRSIAMLAPDRQMIIQVKLSSYGFKESINISRKMSTLYKLCEEQLSQRVQYDFGLPNIVAVLRNFSGYASGLNNRNHQPNDNEEMRVFRMVRDINLSKLIDEDKTLFLSLIDDLLPGNKLATAEPLMAHKELQGAITKNTIDMKLINHTAWNLKINQLYETSMVRHGIMLIGPTGSGKTCCTQILLKSFNDLGCKSTEMRLNPKAITTDEMFGYLDPVTNNWTEGIFSTLWQQTLHSTTIDNCWLILDGPIDCIWMDNLHSVLDDNKILTLANADRIRMAKHTKLIFEIDNVDNASPAAISRVGVVFISSSVLRWTTVFEAWTIHRQDSLEIRIFNECFYSIFSDIYTFVQTELLPKMNILETLYIRQTLDILDGFLMEKKSVRSDKYLKRIFLFALMWSLGSLLDKNDREKFDLFVTEHPSKLLWPKRQPEETIFDYMVNNNGEWVHWSSKVNTFNYPTDIIPEYSSILIPNADSVRTMFLIELIARQKKDILLIGESGTAKTVMIKNFLKTTYDPDEHIFKSIQFSSTTTPKILQKIIKSFMERRVGLQYGPPGQRNMSIFVDDINMPNINKWGDQVTNENLRQIMEQCGFYSLSKPGDFIKIFDLQFIAAMIHPGGGRNDIPNRLKRQFCIFNCTLPCSSSIDMIFGTLTKQYFSTENFNNDIIEFIPKLIRLTRNLWQQIKIKMVLTPRKFHYIFNLHDLSRINQGILTIRDSECNKIHDLLTLWRHECSRVIADRFVSIDDKMLFDEVMRQVVHSEVSEEEYKFDTDEEIYFVHFLRESVRRQQNKLPLKMYEQIPAIKVVKDKLEKFLIEFNAKMPDQKLDLVFFDDFLIHLIKCSRIIRLPSGNALLVGINGYGKQNIIRLASFIAGYKCYQINLDESFLDNLKHIYHTAGLEGQEITLIITDNNIKNEAMLEYINNFLSSGELDFLFTKDEIDEILIELDPIIKMQFPKIKTTKDSLYESFIMRAKTNLHIALSFSPVGNKFRDRTIKFPALLSGCTIDWFQEWPDEARLEVAYYHLHEYLIGVNTPHSITSEVFMMINYIHNYITKASVEYYDKYQLNVFVTPKIFISFLKSFKTLHKQKYNNIGLLQERLQSALDKLNSTTLAAENQQLELNKTKELIAADMSQVETLLHDINVSINEANITKTELLMIKSNAEKLIEQIPIDIQVIMDKVKPIINETENILKTIKPADINLVKEQITKPPYLLNLIMDVVLILFNGKLNIIKIDQKNNFLIPSWSEALKIVRDKNFAENIINFQRDLITDEMIDLLQPYLNNSLYNIEATKTVTGGGNIVGLLKWTLAIIKQHEANRELLPFKANLTIQEYKLNYANNELEKIEQLLTEKKLELIEAEKNKNSVLNDIDLFNEKQNAVQTIINELSVERNYWNAQLSEFPNERNRLIGDMIYFSSFITYAGGFNLEFRKLFENDLMDKLLTTEILITKDFNIIESNLIIDRATIIDWHIKLLPIDLLSIQNAIIIKNTIRFPLLIDPEEQGKRWIDNMEKDNQLKLTTFESKNFRNDIENAIQMGYPIVIESIFNELDPIFDNMLDINLIKTNNTTLYIKFDDKEINYNSDFRLYLITKETKPIVTSKLSSQIVLIDFAITGSGLEDQLLDRIILAEKTENAMDRICLNKDIVSNQRKLTKLQNALIDKFANATNNDNLLNNMDFINDINNNKEINKETQIKIKNAKSTELTLKNMREEYRSVAVLGRVLYFLITSMASVNKMYQTSLVQFLERFDISISKSAKTNSIVNRIENIINYLLFDVYQYISRGLFEKHKFLFGLMMALRIDCQKKNITNDEFEMFIYGRNDRNLTDFPIKPFNWITDVAWKNLFELSKLPEFENLLEQIKNNERVWRSWFQKPKPEDENLPDEYDKLNIFQKLLLIRSWCPDRIYSMCQKYLEVSLGNRFIEPIYLNYELLFKESRSTTPIICILSMESDPLINIQNLAKSYDLPLNILSMGLTEQLLKAKALISDCLANGQWILLQNCHLDLELMNDIVTIVSNLEKGKLENNFRLWITTEIHKNFPISLLQCSIKYIDEQTNGMRIGLERIYTNLTQRFLNIGYSSYYLPLIYGISFFHNILVERNKYCPTGGWTIPYEFNSIDLNGSLIFLYNYLEQLEPKRPFSWSTIRYMLAEIQYGGRIIDEYDKRLLNTFVKLYFNEKICDDSFTFYSGLSSYKIMKFKKKEEYLESINKMDTIDPTQLYGLHLNSDIKYHTDNMQLIFDTIINEIQPKHSSMNDDDNSNMPCKQFVIEQTNSMIDSLPSVFNPLDVITKLQVFGNQNPMVMFLKQEIDQIQEILKIVKTTLNHILFVIQSESDNDNIDDDDFNKIFYDNIPESWKKGSWQSTSLGVWFNELITRHNQLFTWLNNGRPITFWMGGFINPQGFIVSLRQEIVRMHKGWTLDSITIHNEVTKLSVSECKKSPKEGVYVHGMFLENANWDYKECKLIESVNRIFYKALPIIHIYAINSMNPKNPILYQCPVYKKPNRNAMNFITPLWLASVKPPEYWILCGVAMFCNIK